jgi:uncharacterized protein YndB with AHSA1/START domain
MAVASEPVTDTSDREIVVRRTFEAPRELIFSAWTDPRHVTHWWGPHGFSTTTSEMNVRPGGVWRFVMHGPDGVDYKNKIVYVEVERAERLVYDHAGEGDHDYVSFRSTVTFAEQHGKTTVTMRMVFPTAELRDDIARRHGAVEGANQTLQRLGEYVAGMGTAPRELHLTRFFAAPRHLVFKAWTDAKHVASWWGPRGFTNPVCQWDAKPGSPIRVDMTGPDGTVYPMGGEFREVVEPERLVFKTTALRGPGGSPVFEVMNTVTFAEHEGKTKVTVHAVVLNAQPGTDAALIGMREGWGQSLDRLAESLAK